MKTTHPSCTILFKDWGGYKQVKLTGKPLHLNVETPHDWMVSLDSHFRLPVRRPTEVKIVFATGTEKVRTTR